MGTLSAIPLLSSLVAPMMFWSAMVMGVLLSFTVSAIAKRSRRKSFRRCETSRKFVVAQLPKIRNKKQISLTVPGINIYEDSDGRHVAFAEGLPAETFNAFLDAMMKDGLEFSLYDPRYPSTPEDPGAYLSYSPQKGRWRMTLAWRTTSHTKSRTRLPMGKR